MLLRETMPESRCSFKGHILVIIISRIVNSYEQITIEAFAGRVFGCDKSTNSKNRM